MRKVLLPLFASLLALTLAHGALAKDEKSAAKAAPAAEKKAEDRLDINSANEKLLMTLDGIGEARAKAIIKGRPYRGKDELVTKKILPEAVYEKIKDQIIAKQKPGANK